MTAGPEVFRIVVLLVLALASCSPSPNPVDPGGSLEESPATAEPSPVGPAELAPSADPDSAGLPPFVASVQPIGSALRDRMAFSHRPGCPLNWAQLRHLRISFVGFDGFAHVGEIVVHRDHASEVTEAFRQLYEARWPIHRMTLVDEYEGDDNRSMAANNTSGYNCRRVAGGGEWSAHAYGAAIDINPVQNPYVTMAAIAPPSGRKFAGIDRSADGTVPAGVIRDGDVVVRAFASIGWEWGGDWASKDYQHFSATNR